MKYKIEKDSVQETLIIPLYGRKLCSELYPEIFSDKSAARIIEGLDYDFSEMAKKTEGTMQRFGILEVAMRQSDLAFEVKDYLKTHPNAAVVKLGCGLDNTGRLCDNGTCRIYNLDFPDVIKVRDELLPAGEREENIGCDLNDTSWFERVPAESGAVFIAAGVFYYFLKEQVKELVVKMADAFPGGKLAFDAAGPSAVKMMIKSWVRELDIQDVNAYFSVKDAKAELSGWSDKITVSSRAYMQGYQSLKRPEISGFFRFLSKVGDGMMKMQIVRIDLSEN